MPVQSCGYLYAPPACPDSFSPANSKIAVRPSGGVAMTLQNLRAMPNPPLGPAQRAVPYVVFEDVVCTDYSYEIDIFLDNAASTDSDPVTNPAFIGRVFRLGMGLPTQGGELRNKSRCRKPAVVRVIDARHVEESIAKGFQQSRTEDDC